MIDFDQWFENHNRLLHLQGDGIQGERIKEHMRDAWSAKNVIGWINVEDRLPKNGDKVMAKYDGVYTNRSVVFWFDFNLKTHFGRINEPDGKGSQPATHWAPIPPEDK